MKLIEDLQTPGRLRSVEGLRYNRDEKETFNHFSCLSY